MPCHGAIKPKSQKLIEQEVDLTMVLMNILFRDFFALCGFLNHVDNGYHAAVYLPTAI